MKAKLQEMEKFDLQRPIKLYWPFLRVPENWISKKHALGMKKVPLYRISQGESVNCDSFSGCFCVHAQATHTENLSHISTTSTSKSKNSLEIEQFFPVLLWDFRHPHHSPNNDSFSQLANDLDGEFIQCKGIVIRCLSQDEQSFLPVELALALNRTCILHLFTNLVSVDAEESKSLPFHRAFLSCDEGFPLKSITELCCIDDELPCGLYLMCLTIWNCDSDASPSFPVLFPLKECQ